MRAENQSQLQSSNEIKGYKDNGEIISPTNDSDCYSDSNNSEIIDNNLLSVFKFQGDIVRHTSDEFKVTLVQYQKELLAAISGAERSEAIRQSRELELTRANIINKKLSFTCDQQAKQLTDLQEHIKLANEKSEAVVQSLTTNFETERNQSLARENVLQEQLKIKTEQANVLQNCLNETQARLEAVLANEEELHSTVDRLTRELSHAAEEKLKTALLMESELNDATVLKLNHDSLIHQYESLRDRFEQTEKRLITLRAGFPTIVRQAVLKAVETVQAAAAVQLESANDRLHKTEMRLEQQLDRLRSLEFGRTLATCSSTPPQQEINPKLMDDTTNITRPVLKPRSKTLPEWETEQKERDMVLTLSEPDHKPGFSKGLNQPASVKLNPHELYTQLCQVIQMLEGDVQAVGMHPKPGELSNSLTRTNRVRSASIDKCAPTKLRPKVPAPPWRVPSSQPQTVHPPMGTKLPAVTNQSHKLSKPLAIEEDSSNHDYHVSFESRCSKSESRVKDQQELWSKIEVIVNHLYELTRFRNDLTKGSENRTIQRLRLLELENQRLQRKLQQCLKQSNHAPGIAKCRRTVGNIDTCLRSSEEELYQVGKMDSSEVETDVSGTHLVHGRKATRNCLLQPHKYYQSSEYMRELEERCVRALNEAGRWQRRWREQEGQLKAERERISMMKIHQQADLQIREHFLYSVCKLVQEASHQIEHIVKKTTTSNGVLLPPKPRACRWHSSDGAHQLCTSAHHTSTQHPEHDTQLAQKKPTNCALNHSEKLGHWNTRFGLTTPHGDGQRALVDSLPNRMINTSQLQETTPEAIESLPNTNWNNNEVATSSTSEKKVAVHQKSYRFSQDCGNQQHVSKDGHLCPKYDNLRRELLLGGSPVPSVCSVISDVRSTSTISDSPSSIPEDSLNPIPVTTEHGESAHTSMVEVNPIDGAASEASILASSHFVAATSNSSENPERWNELREAVRYELSRVLANVISQAKEDNSIAQECLQAISDLQAQLENEPTTLPRQEEPIEVLTASPECSNEQITATTEALREERCSTILSGSSRVMSLAHRLSHLNSLNGSRTHATAAQVDQATTPTSLHAHRSVRSIKDRNDHPNRPYPVTGSSAHGAPLNPRLTRMSVSNTDGAVDTPNPGLERKRTERTLERPRWRPAGKTVQYVTKETTPRINRLHSIATRPSKLFATGKKDQSPKVLENVEIPTKEGVLTKMITNSEETIKETHLGSSDNYSHLKMRDTLTGLDSQSQIGPVKPHADHDEDTPDGFSLGRPPRNIEFDIDGQRDSPNSVAHQRECVELSQSVLGGGEGQDLLSERDCFKPAINTQIIAPSSRAIDNSEPTTTATATMFVAVNADSEQFKSSSESNNNSTAPVLWISEVEHDVNSFFRLTEHESSKACCCGTACCTIDADGL